MRRIEPQAAQGGRLGCCNGAALVGPDLTSRVIDEQQHQTPNNTGHARIRIFLQLAGRFSD
jgi:hypothetical protein